MFFNMDKNQNNITKQALGSGMMKMISDLYPICRSITGDGVRETLSKIEGIIPLDITEIPTGTKIFDWEIPMEWNIRDAYVKDPEGNKIIDFKQLNLHVLNYSTPIHQKMDLESLKKHLFSIPEKPDWVPYRTSYYSENWGFCLSHNQLLQLKEGEYEICIDSTLKKGHLTYGEILLKGKTEEEILISTHICHPSLANDNLAGNAVCAYLANFLKNTDHYYSYRFIFIPGTIGAIAWLAQNEDKIHNIKYGLVTSLLGIDSLFTYKRTRSGNTTIDKIVEHILNKEYPNHKVIDFIPYGYDERQFCSPGINLAVGNLTRIPYSEYPEYHTSADNVSFISEKALVDSYDIFKRVFQFTEADRKYMNLFPKGEPQLGKRGLYDNVGGRNDSKILQLAFLWVLNFSDGNNSLIDIAIRSDMTIDIITEAASMLFEKGLLKEL
jgi:aminopeptidase-like protein